MSAPAIRTIAMDQEIMDGWAALSGDFNPLHVDPEYAAATQFGGTIAHGHYTLALMEQLMLDGASDAWRSGGTLRKVRFRAPVRPGATYVLTASPAVDEPGAWRLELRPRDDEDVLAAEAEAVILTEPPWEG
jgi:3-hydroxybutyryl-CoA dehydratase